MKQTILNKIMSNKRFEEVVSVRERLSEKYGEIIVVGGCLADCYFDKDFYDIDMIISYKDLKDEWKQAVDNNKRCKTHILHVLRDEIDGQDIDIIVVDYSVAKHIRRFDQTFKQIWLDNKGLHIKKQAVKDITENRISINTVNGPVVYFRIIKSARKYNMMVDTEDLFLLENFMSTLSHIKLSKKYAPMKREFMPYKRPSAYLGKIVYKYSTLYWNTKIVFIPSWRILRKATAWYMQLINWKHIR
jgi:hypothetical protein